MDWEFKQQLFISQRRVSPQAVADLASPTIRAQLEAHIDSLGTLPRAGSAEEYARLFEAVYPAEADRRAYLEAKIAGAKPSFGQQAVEEMSLKSVLLVDDNEDLADVVAELLRLHGVVVRVAYDGPSALQSALKTVPDVTLCDLGLPGMDGFEVARACRAEPSLRNVRLVAASGYSSAEYIANAQSAGVDSLLIKPLSEESLRTLLH